MAKTNNSVATTDSFLGRKFQRVGKDVVVEVVMEDEKAKTVIIEFPEGKTMNISRSTLKDKRLWQPYEGEMPEAKEPEVETYIPGTPTEESQVRDLKKEAKEEAAKKRAEERAAKKAEKEEAKKKAKAEAKLKADKSPTNFVADLYKVADELELTIKNREKTPNLFCIRCASANLMDLYKGKATMCVSVKEAVAIKLGLEYTVRKNCIFPASIKYEYSQESINTVKAILQSCLEYAAEVNEAKKSKNVKEEN